MARARERERVVARARHVERQDLEFRVIGSTLSFSGLGFTYSRYSLNKAVQALLLGTPGFSMF